MVNGNINGNERGSKRIYDLKEESANLFSFLKGSGEKECLHC